MTSEETSPYFGYLEVKRLGRTSYLECHGLQRELVDQRIALVWGFLSEKSLGLGHGWNSAGEVQVNPPHELCVVRERCNGAMLLCVDEGIDPCREAVCGRRPARRHQQESQECGGESGQFAHDGLGNE